MERKIKKKLINTILVVLLALFINACNSSDNNVTKTNFPKPAWDDKLINIKNAGEWYTLATEENNEMAAYNIGVAYNKLNNNNKAIEWYLYSNSIKSNKDNLFNLASTYNDLGQVEKAIRRCKKGENR
eukprot:TRINITY_DN15251_c0_g1_i1.p2 TRINITY_DN15251_c0_g1~~TRINITY_DN15251_c0_g1_i1.p2  ORF type:complete len:128 (+),score=19.56 TRINITY_DN15251_c0_g1_i1:534-917(+)